MGIDFEKHARDILSWIEVVTPPRTPRLVEALRQLAADVLEEAAKEADEERDCAATDNADMRSELGDLYDPNCYGTGYDAGRKAAAECIGENIRTRAREIQEGK